MSSNSLDLTQSTVRGALWTYVAFYSGKAIVFASTIILARLLSKDNFGVVGYALTTIGFLDIIRDLGIGSALIYHRSDPRAPNTAFWLSLTVSLALYAIVWVSAPAIGLFFNDPRAALVTQVLALNFPLSALGSTQETLLIKALAFDRKFIPDFAQAMSKGVFSVGLALAGFGPWSLIIGHLLGTAVSVVAVWWLVKWRPAFQVSLPLVRSLLRFGLPMVGVNAIGIFVLNIDYLFVGRFLGPEALGIYTLAFRIPDLLILQFCGLIASVVFPVYAKMRDDSEALRRGFLNTTRYLTLITTPLALGIALLAGPFVLTVFTEKWADAIPVMRAIAIYALLLSLAFNAGDVYKAEGRPGVLTQISFVKACILVPGLWLAVRGPGTLIAVGWVQIVAALAGSLLNMVVAVRLLRLPVSQLLAAFFPALIAGVGLVLTTLLTLYLLAGTPSWLQLVSGTLVGGLAYCGVLWWLQRDVVIEASQVLRTALIRR